MSWSIDKHNLAFVPNDPDQNFSDDTLIPVNEFIANKQAAQVIQAKELNDFQSSYLAVLGDAFGYIEKLLKEASQLPIRRIPYTGGSSFLTGCGGDTGTKCEAFIPGKEDQSFPVNCYADLDGDGHSNGDEADSPDGIIDSNNPNDTSPDTIDPNPTDLDGDGVTVAQGDCADDPAVNSWAASIHPGADDQVGNNIDENCDKMDGVDADQDGCASIASGGDDCNDNSFEIKPNTFQRFVDVDTNCNRTLDVSPTRDAVLFLGEEGGYEAGKQVALGDVTGDGVDDVIIRGGYDSGTWPDVKNGRIYIFDGALHTFKSGSTIKLADADIIITGGADQVADTDSASGWAIGYPLKVVDLNNDGVKDLMFGVETYGPNQENAAIAVMFGRNNFPAHWDMHGFDLWNQQTLQQNNMALIKGPRPDERPNNLDSDAFMGTNWRLTEWSPDGKETTLLAGHAAGFNSQTTTDVIPLRGLSAGVMVAYHDLVKYQIHSPIDSDSNDAGGTDIGDSNGDGKGDIIIGNYREFPNSEDNVVFIKSNATPLPRQIHSDRLSETPSIDWFKFTCQSNQNALGVQVKLEDIDGDNRADLIFADSTFKTLNPNGSVLYDGMLYVLPASQVGLAATGQHPSGIVINKGSNLSVIYDFPLLGGYQIVGDVNPTQLGYVNGEGIIPTDMNGDGISELLIPTYGHPNAQSYLFDFTKMAPGTYKASQAQQSLSWDFKTRTYACNGDIDGDGASDCLLGAPSLADPNNPNQQSSVQVGGAYLTFGLLQ